MPPVRKRKVVLGVGAPSSEIIVLNKDFENLAVANPMSIADFRSATDWTAGAQSNMTYLSVNDSGDPKYGKVITWYSPAATYGTANAHSFNIPLTQEFDYGYVQYDTRFRDGFNWSLGGKQPGLAGKSSVLSSPPSGGAPSWFGWSGRFMWLADSAGGHLATNDEIIGYLYTPYLDYSVYGLNRSTMTGYGSRQDNLNSNGTWRNVKQVYKMNTVINDKLNADKAIWDAAVAAGTQATATPSATLNVDYLADGLHEIWIDGVLKYRKTDEIFRFYPDVHIGYDMWSQFRGGKNDATHDWTGSTDGYVDIANYKVVKLG